MQNTFLSPIFTFKVHFIPLVIQDVMKKIAFISTILLLLIGKTFAQTNTLTEQEIEDLKYLYEEERLANDVYTQLAKKWKSRIFVQIAKSEKRHYTYLLDRLEKHHIPIPKNEVSFYNSGQLNDRYDEFLHVGMRSYEEALQAAAQFEEYDIVDLQNALALTDKRDLQLVYRYLISGAKIHLAVLYRKIKRKNGSYQPVLLKQSEFDNIINSGKKGKRKRRMLRHKDESV